MPTQQSIHYTFDLRSPALSAVEPIDLQYPRVPNSGMQNSEQSGGFPLYIPSGIDFDPSNPGSGLGRQAWSFVNAEKRAAIIASHPGFSYMLQDDMEDATSFDMSTASGVFAGGRGAFSMGVYLSNATITTNAATLFNTPNDAYVWVDGGDYVPELDSWWTDTSGYEDPKTGRCRRYFRPMSIAALLQLDVSFNGGSTWITNVGTGLVNIPVPDQGASFKLRITRINSASYVKRILILGWGLVY